MSYENILGTIDFMESLRGKKATFLLALSNSKTYEIKGITQAGIPGFIHLTPTLDSEFVSLGEVRSLDGVAETPKGVPTPALITRAVHELKPFSKIELLDLGLEVKPKISHLSIYNFDLKPSSSIKNGSDINALDVFQKGLEFGKNYKSTDDYIILGESVPSGTTTANALVKALGYEVEGMFSSSFKNNPKDIKQEVIKSSLEAVRENDDIFTIIGKVADNMLIFNAGFLLGANANQTKIVLAGGTQMAAVLLLVNSIVKNMNGVYDSSNTALCTTSWVSKDENSNIKALLEQLDFKTDAYFATFDFELSSHPALKLYDQGEAKEGVGAGAALIYALINGLRKEDIIKKVESYLGV